MLAYISNYIPTVINFSPSDANVTKPVVEYCVRNNCINVLQQYITSVPPTDIINISLDAKEFVFLTLVPDCKHYLSYLDHIDFIDNLPSILPLLQVNNEFIMTLFYVSCAYEDSANLHYLCSTYKDIISVYDPLLLAQYCEQSISNILAKYFTAEIRHLQHWKAHNVSIKHLLWYNPKLLISYIKPWSY